MCREFAEHPHMLFESDELHWFCIKTRPKQEGFAKRSLIRDVGVEVFCPMRLAGLLAARCGCPFDQSHHVNLNVGAMHPGHWLRAQTWYGAQRPLCISS